MESCLHRPLHSNGKRTFHDILSFGETIYYGILLAEIDRPRRSHPNLFQIYGIVSTGRLHGVVFHDGCYSLLQNLRTLMGAMLG
jgi:hypothetical protein